MFLLLFAPCYVCAAAWFFKLHINTFFQLQYQYPFSSSISMPFFNLNHNALYCQSIPGSGFRIPRVQGLPCSLLPINTHYHHAKEQHAREAQKVDGEEHHAKSNTKNNTHARLRRLTTVLRLPKPVYTKENPAVLRLPAAVQSFTSFPVHR